MEDDEDSDGGHNNNNNMDNRQRRQREKRVSIDDSVSKKAGKCTISSFLSRDPTTPPPWG